MEELAEVRKEIAEQHSDMCAFISGRLLCRKLSYALEPIEENIWIFHHEETTGKFWIKR